jgi:hypothetical protein
LLTLRADWFIYRKPLDREVSQAWIIPLGGVVQKLMQAHSAQHRNAAAFSLHPGCLSGRTRSADQPPSITAPTMLLCPSRKPWRAVMLPSPPCESLSAGVHCGDGHYIGRKGHRAGRAALPFGPGVAAAIPRGLSVKFGRLVKKEQAVVRKTQFTRTRIVAPTISRTAKIVKQAENTLNFRSLDRHLGGHGGDDCCDPR